MDASNMDAARKALEERRANGEDVGPLSAEERARRKPTSFRLAVVAMCAQCVGGYGARTTQTVRRDIRECTSPRCALYHLRPFRSREEA